VPIVPAGAGSYRKDQCRDAATAALTCGDRRGRRCSTSAGPPGTASARGAHGRPGTAHVLRTADGTPLCGELLTRSATGLPLTGDDILGAAVARKGSFPPGSHRWFPGGATRGASGVKVMVTCGHMTAAPRPHTFPDRRRHPGCHRPGRGNRPHKPHHVLSAGHCRHGGVPGQCRCAIRIDPPCGPARNPAGRKGRLPPLRRRHPHRRRQPLSDINTAASPRSTRDTPATTSRQRTPSRTPAFSSRSGQSVPASWRDSPSSPARRVGDMRELQLISYNLFATACYCHPSCRSMLIRALASHARNSAWGSLTDCSVPVHYVTVGAFVGSGTEPGPSETPGASRANSVRQSPPTASVAGPAAVNGPSTTSTALPRPTRRSARSGR